MITELTDNLTLAINSLIPLRTVVSKKRQPPWINNDLRVLYRKRDAALRRHKRTARGVRAKSYLTGWLKNVLSRCAEEDRRISAQILATYWP